MGEKYKYTYTEQVEGIISDVVVDGKAILFQLNKFLDENGLTQRQIEKYSKSKGEIEVHQSFLSRLALGKTKSLDLTQFLSLLVYLSELTGKDVQPNDIIRIVPVERVEESDG